MKNNDIGGLFYLIFYIFQDIFDFVDNQFFIVKIQPKGHPHTQDETDDRFNQQYVDYKEYPKKNGWFIFGIGCDIVTISFFSCLNGYSRGIFSQYGTERGIY